MIKYSIPKRPYRYDFFTIWGNGLSHIDEILTILRNETALEIIRIESRQVQNMEKFVFDLYACDTVPINHLRSKLKYLFEVSPEIVIIFVKNLSPQERPAGQGAFRKVQCQYINQIKIEIRNKFNPRHLDKEFQIEPLEKGVSHEHVIHASDYEEQVDYFLKLLGHREGINFLESNDSDLPFQKPYQLPRPEKYTFKRVALEDLRALIHTLSDSQEVQITPTKIKDTPHYLALSNGKGVYDKYLQQFRYTYLKDDHYWEKLSRMRKLDESKIRAFEPILVVQEKGYYRILDGVHRTAVALFRGLSRIKCVEFIN